MTDTELKNVQLELGCDTCRYADKRAIGKGPCCTHVRGPNPIDGGEQGKACRTRRPLSVLDIG